MSKKIIKSEGYNWNYVSLGGVVRVQVTSGEDIAHLGELDQKLWTVLSCPVDNINLDPETLKCLDTDADGNIRVPEIIAAANKLTGVLKNRESILKGEASVSLDNVNTESAEGAKFEAAAKGIFKSLGMTAGEITLAETAQVLAAQQHYQDCCDYNDWFTAGEGNEAVAPYGADTAAALAAVEALNNKIEDYFMRCKLIAFNSGCSATLAVSAEKIGELNALDLSTCGAQIASYPIASPDEKGVLPFAGINPAWQGAFAALKSLVLDKELKGAEGLTEDQWKSIVAKFADYKAWQAAKKGAAVEAEGIEAVRAAIEEGNQKGSAGTTVSREDVSYVSEILHYNRDLFALLKNYISFTDFYTSNRKERALFEAGELYVDQRCCNLCIRVKDMGGHCDMAAQSGMCLVYCHCVSKTTAKSVDIVAVMTDGQLTTLRPGKKAIFYDLDGNDYDAVITKVVDNPINVKQAFLSPYRKLGKFVSDKITKGAAEKENKVTANMQAAADKGPEAAAADKKSSFDIAKFAGIFAALGMALGMIGSALMKLIDPWYNILILACVIVICVSGPSMFLAWIKLRKRNLGPVLNANGWAINSVVLVNVLFGKTLTSVAKYPIAKLNDPFVKKDHKACKIITAIVILLLAAGAALYFTDNLKFMGINRKAKAQTEQVAEQPAEAPVEKTTE